MCYKCSIYRDEDLYTYKSKDKIVRTMYEISDEDIEMLLNLFIRKIEETNYGLSVKQFLSIKEYVKKHLFVVDEYEEEDKWEYKYWLTFIYKGKLLQLYWYKSYSSDFEILHLSKNV